MKLKPCPFCGHKHLAAENNPLWTIEGKRANAWHVLCHACTTTGPGANLKRNAVKLWNSRHSK